MQILPEGSNRGSLSIEAVLLISDNKKYQRLKKFVINITEIIIGYGGNITFKRNIILPHVILMQK